jgi:transcriptional regulator with XRE-family HTH domain
MLKTFRQAFLETLERTREPVAKIAREAGVSEEQLKKVKQRENASTNVDDAVKVAHHFGMSLDEFLDDETVRLRGEVLAVYAQLTPAERQLLQDLAKARHVQAPAED